MTIKERLDQIAQRAYSSRETVQASYDVARLVIEHDIPGDFVECGVAAGSNAAAMALPLANLQGHIRGGHNYQGRRLHLFDSFMGIPACGPEDTEWIAADHKPGIVAHSQADVARNMREWGIQDKLLVWHPGMFEDTVRPGPLGRLPHADLMSIALLRLDGDLYESTRVCLEYLYPLVSPGGWIIVDDFGLTGARKAVLESPLAGGPAYFQKGR